MFPDWAWDVTTPSLIYLMDKLSQSASIFADFCDINDACCYFAVKANRQPRILAAVSEAGLGFDIASREEFQLVRQQAACKIVATSPGLNSEVMIDVDALSGTIFFDNCAQLELARQCGLDARRHGIRVALPGSYAAFGFSVAEISKLNESGFPIRKVHLHTGEYTDQANVEKRLHEARSIVGEFDLDVIDFGGGFGVLSNNHDRLEIALSTMKAFSQTMDAKMFIEPGKAVVARCGLLVVSVLASKERSDGAVIVVDSSSFNLGQMEVRHLSKTSGNKTSFRPTLVVGPTCYEGDIWGRFNLPQLLPGDRLLFSNMGAYTMSIAATLHGLPSPKEIFID